MQAVEKPASQDFFYNKREKDVAAAAAPEETGGRNEFRHPLKYDTGKKDESKVFAFFDKLIMFNGSDYRQAEQQKSQAAKTSMQKSSTATTLSL
jgi:hypothetical protein